MNRLSEMESFVAVVETGGFTDAARRLRISKSAISKQISALEDRLGARLLDRTTRNVAATEIGMSYYQEAVKVLQIASNADAMVASMQTSPQGRLRLTAPMDFGQTTIAPLCAKFINAYPDVSIDLVFENRIVDLLAEKFDLAIRIGPLPDSGLMARKLTDFEMCLVASPSYLDQKGPPKSVKDIEGLDLLHFSNNQTGTVWNINDGDEMVAVRALKSPFTVNDGTSLMRAAVDGLGVAYLPRFMLSDQLSDGVLVQLFPDAPLETRPIHAVYQPGPFIQPKLRNVVDFLVAEFKTLKV
ncbi:MAG: LysR family transcriptional regulator [Pseudomonadota bacterium]